MKTSSNARRRSLAPAARFLRDRTAGPVVEFAIIVPVLLVIIFGVVDFSFAFMQRNALVTAAREGARFGAVQATPPCSNATAIRNATKIRYVGIVPGDSLTSAMISVSPASCPSPPVDTFSVRIQNVPLRSVTPLFVLLKRSGITLSARAVFRYERS